MRLPSGPSSSPPSIHGPVPISLVLSENVFEALLKSTQGMVHDLVISWQLACSKYPRGHLGERGMCRQRLRDQGHADFSCSDGRTCEQAEECQLLRGRLEGSVPPAAPVTLHSRQLCSHLGGVTFQCSEVEFRTILSSWYELCFLPRQSWQSTGKFSFER